LLAEFLEILNWKVVDDVIAISDVMAEHIEEKSGRDVMCLDPVDIDHFVLTLTHKIPTIIQVME
jgi:hypothetical protein